VRLPFVNISTLESALRTGVVRPLEQIDAMLRIAKDEWRLTEVDPELRTALMDRLSERPKLQVLREWWGAIPTGVQITSVGRVLATANAKRLDSAGMLPALD
jgi:hypothetical protein